MKSVLAVIFLLVFWSADLPASAWQQKSSGDAAQGQERESAQADEPAGTAGTEGDDANSVAPALEFDERYNRRFLEKNPLTGETISDLTAYGADGNKFSFETLRGRPTVVVFGCLT